jgi:hypothetical protein
VYLVILLAAAAILGGVVTVAMGRGGEMALFDRDLPVKITRLGTPGEVATLRLPVGLFGYQTRATGEALIAAANLLARRDAEIVALRREIWRLGGDGQMVVSQASAPEPDFAVPEPAAPDPGFAAAGFVDEEVGAVTYTSTSLAAWYDSIARSGAADSPEAGPSNGTAAYASQPSRQPGREPGRQPGFGDDDEPAEESLGASEAGQDKSSPLDESSRLDETSRLDQDGRP